MEEAAASDMALCDQQRRQQIRDRQAQLRPTTSVDDAIAHALLAGMSRTPAEMTADPDASGREFRAAQRRWPANLDLAWYALQHCAPSLGCDPDRQWQRVHAQDQDNALVWMRAMGEAHHRHDTLAWERALHQAATSRIYDNRRGTTYLRILPLTTGLPVPDACRSAAASAVVEDLLGGSFTAANFASFQAAAIENANNAFALVLAGLTPCRDASSLSSTSRQDCRALLARIAAGDTLIEQSLALSLMVQLVGDGPGHARWRERYRWFLWLQGLAPDAFRTLKDRSAPFSEGEMTMLRDYAIAHDQWPPPDDWLPDDARSRSLILTGRPSPPTH